MNLLEKKEQLRLILKQSDLINTINGGIVNTAVNIERTENNIILQISAPSVSGKAFKVLLNHDQLTVFHLLTVKDSSHYNKGEFMSMPMFIKTFGIPENVDLNNIQAQQKNDEIIIILPLKENNASQRDFDIREL
jgi:HSP20 family protein